MEVLLRVCMCLTVRIWVVIYFSMANETHVHNALRQAGTDVTRIRHDAEEKSGYPCGEGQCVCYGVSADCSGKGLRFIPQLPSNITRLQFRSNLLSPRVTYDIFTNITSVTWLDLSDNLIGIIRPGTFQRLTKLTYLDLSNNPITCDDLPTVLGIPTLESLVIEYIFMCDRIEQARFEQPMPRLQKLVLSQAMFLNLTFLSPFIGLRRISLYQFLKIVMFEALSEMTNLTYLDIRSSCLSCDDLVSVLTIPTLKVLHARHLSKCFDSPNVGAGAHLVSSCTIFPDVGTGGPIPNLEELDVSLTKYQSLNLTYLLPFTRLRILYLNHIEDIPAIVMYQALHQLTNLTVLKLNSNKVSCEDLWTLLTIPSLEELHMRYGTVCTGIKTAGPRLTTSSSYPNAQKAFGPTSAAFGPRTAVRGPTAAEVGPKAFTHWDRKRSRLAKLDLSHNKLQDINVFFDLVDLRNLRHVDLSNNKIRVIESVHILIGLEVLHIRDNILYWIPETCNKGLSLFPALLELDLSQNAIIERPAKQTLCLPRLQSLNLSENQIKCLGPGDFELTFKTLKHLKTLDLSNQRIVLIDTDSFTNPNLKSLSLADNSISFANEETVEANIFLGCPILEELILTNNDLTGISEKRFQQLFGHLKHLTSLSLRSTGLSYITASMFTGLVSLQELDLSSNSLTFLPNAAFESLPQLVMIGLCCNKITVIQESAFSLTTRQRLQSIDLSLNPFVCSCDILFFKKWLVNTPSMFSSSVSDYTCGNLYNTPVTSFFMQKQACIFSPETSKFIIVTISLIFIGMSLLLFFYRYRWHIRLILHEVFRGPEERLRRLREHRFEYDVFVSYDSEDFPWVIDHLTPSLEENMGLKLCIHQRDFIPGCPIVENIERTVQTSKKLLMLFSRSFAQSQWCQFELQLCLTHAVDTQDVLIVVMLEDIPSRELTPAMIAVMKTTTYIEWADEADARDSFWRRMRLALHEILLPAA